MNGQTRVCCIFPFKVLVWSFEVPGPSCFCTFLWLWHEVYLLTVHLCMMAEEDKQVCVISNENCIPVFADSIAVCSNASLTSKMRRCLLTLFERKSSFFDLMAMSLAKFTVGAMREHPAHLRWVPSFTDGPSEPSNLMIFTVPVGYIWSMSAPPSKTYCKGVSLGGEVERCIYNSNVNTDWGSSSLATWTMSLWNISQCG